MMSNDEISERLQIETDDDGVTVYAKIFPGDEELEYSEEWLENQLSLQGCLGISIASQIHEKIVDLLSKNTESKVKLGKKVDAKVAVRVSPDLLSVNLSITAAKGGKHVETKDIVAALKDKDIDLTYVNKRIVVALIRRSQSIEAGEIIEHIVAHGTAPVHGKDTQFKHLVENVVDRKPHERNDGTLDYYDLGVLVCVDEGEELMRKYPPTPAINGRSVTGKELSARLGKNLSFGKCKGAEPSSFDPDLLISTLKGQPIFNDNGVTVESLYTVKKVDLHTGHVDYDGSIVVKGDVMPGMKIKVSGDVQVFGMVENASIEAGGNVDIKLGAIGRAWDSNAENKVQIRCKGNLSAGHIENFFIDAQGDVLIKSRISNCDVKAGSQVIVGNHKEMKSGIVGGNVIAGSIIRTEALGSSGSTLTQVSIECSSDVTEEMNTIKKNIVEHDELLVSKLGLMVGLSKKHTEETQQSLQTVKQETEALKAEINDLILRRGELELLVEQVAQGKIIVQREAFPGVTIKILDQETVIKARYAQGAFLLNMGAISFSVSV